MENNKIIIYNPKLLNREYGVNLYYSMEGENVQRIQYNAGLQYCKSYGNNKSILSLTKKNIVINQNKSDEHIYRLAIECNNSFYPILVGVDRFGQLDIIQANTILDRWIKKRPEIERYYKGVIAEKYMNTIEDDLHDKSKVKSLITNDLFYSQFFKIVYGEKSMCNDVSFVNNLYLAPFQGYLTFRSKQTISYDEILNSVSVNHQGVLHDQYIISDFFRKYSGTNLQDSLLSGRYYLDYSLDNNNQLIDAIEGHFDLYVGDKTILNIRMEAYYLEEMVENSEKGYAETNREFNEKVSLWDSFINFFS